MNSLKTLALRLAVLPRGRSAVVLVAATAGTFLTYLVVYLAAQKESYLYVLFYERSWLQQASTFCFWGTLAALGLEQLRTAVERDAYDAARRILEAPDLTGPLRWTDAHRVRSRLTDAAHAPWQASIVFSRIVRGMDRLRKSESTSDLESYFRIRAEADAMALETGYAGIRFAIWLIPTLGFIGTVWGIGVGIAGFADIVQESRKFSDVQRHLPVVTSQLGTAFDTTLLALGLSAIVVFYMSFLLKRQEEQLADIDALCFDEVCALFEEHTSASAEVVRALGESVEELRKGMNGNRGSVEAVIRNELPALFAARLIELLKGDESAALRSIVTEVRTALIALGESQERLARIEARLDRSTDAPSR